MNTNSKKNSVCVIGLGFVGLTLAAIMSEVGFRVHGIEKKKFIIDKLKKKQSHFYEPKLNELLIKIVKKKNFYFLKKIYKLKK